MIFVFIIIMSLSRYLITYGSLELAGGQLYQKLYTTVIDVHPAIWLAQQDYKWFLHQWELMSERDATNFIIANNACHARHTDAIVQSADKKVKKEKKEKKEKTKKEKKENGCHPSIVGGVF